MKTREQIMEILKREFEFLANEYSINKLALFGSYVRGNQNENSDIDILIEFYRPIGLKIVDLKLYLDEILEVKVDIVSSRSIDMKFYSMIKNELKYV